MKNKLLLGAMLIGFTSLFTACTDDNDSNPTLIQPKEFVLNTPAYASSTVDLQKSTNFELSWSQPKYTAENAPINAIYEIQVSPTNSFTVSTTEAEADESGKKTADYACFNKTFSTCTADPSTEELNKNLLKIMKWDEKAVPAEQVVYVRVNAFVAEGTKRLNEILSNTIEIKVKPYYQVIKDADPELWYLIGDCVGDGSWGNDNASNIGVSQIPLCPIEGEKYDATTGQGNLTYTGYFVSAKGFKIIKNQAWDDYEWGSKDGTPVLKKDNGGNGGDNFKVEKDGYYTINLNTKTNTLSIKATEEAPTEYSSMYIIGVNGDWENDLVMKPVDIWDGAKPHVWKYDLTVAADTELKFRSSKDRNHDNWGSKAFPYGWAAKGGDNIPVKAGSYTILFNDITGYYTFITK